jgi:copper/silver efflux system protein
MINRLIEASVRFRSWVFVAYAAIALWGYWAISKTAIDAIPDLSENQVLVFTEWSGRSPQEVEDQITYPLTLNLQGLPEVKTVRSSSAFGFSMVTVIFDDATDLYFARTRILERLSTSSLLLPQGVTPVLGPDATSIGQVLWYTVEGPYDLAYLRSVQDWFIRFQLGSVPGVAEVSSVGGFVRQYQIDLDPVKLRAHNISIQAVLQAVERSNTNVGAKVVEANDREYAVRGLGLIRSVDDIDNIVVATSRGVPIQIRNVATVRMGPGFRRGVLDKAGTESVGGVVTMRYGANARQVIQDVKARIGNIEPGLPQGIKLVPFYDRSGLIDRAVDTLQNTLIEELILVALVHVVFLWHFRSILIVTLPLPLAVMSSFLLMYYTGISSNIMSLGGIAIAIGVLVDAGIVITENVLRHVEAAHVQEQNRHRSSEIILRSSQAMGRPVFLNLVAILMTFLPVFAIKGIEGKLFHPLAYTKTFAVAASALMAVTLVPALCSLLVRGRVRLEEENPVMRVLHAAYRPMLLFALRHRPLVLGSAAVLFAFSVYLFSTIGSEFVPTLDEETALWMPIADPAISLTKATELLKRQDEIIARDPAVEMVVGKVGRAETPTDPAPINMTETIITFKPRQTWPKGTTKNDILRRLDEKLRIPGISGFWSQPIQNRVDMLSSGIRTQLGVKIFGKDQRVIEQKAIEIERILRTIPGNADLYAERTIGAPYIDIQINRDAAAQSGVLVGDVQEVIETAIGGKTVTSVAEGRERYPVVVRYADDFRQGVDSIKNVLVFGAEGVEIPLSTLASIRSVLGPSMINSENGTLRGTVLMNVRGRDLGGFLTEAKRRLAQEVSLPPGYYLQWSGQYEDQDRAKFRLQIVIPAVAVLVFLLLCIVYRSRTDALQVLLAVPFSLTGGVFLLKLLGYNFSISVWVGFIALFGTASQTAVVMVLYLNEALARKESDRPVSTREDIDQAVVSGAVLRLRPKLMTVATVVAGLLPIMWSTNTGAEVMKPIAAPVLGGMITSLVHVLIVTPVLYASVKARSLGIASSAPANVGSTIEQ